MFLGVSFGNDGKSSPSEEEKFFIVAKRPVISGEAGIQWLLFFEFLDAGTKLFPDRVKGQA